MALQKITRSLVVAALTAAVAFSTGCSEKTADHKTIKEEQYQRWNLAKISIQYQVAQQQYAVGDYDKCQKTLIDAMAVGEPHAGLQMLAAKVDIEKGSLESAAEHLRTAIAIKGDEPEAFYLMGVVYQRWQKMDQAMGYYQQAWDLKTAEARYMLAVVEMKISLGDLNGAEEVLSDKRAYFEQTAAVRVALARIALLRKDYAAAAKFFRQANVLVPEDMNVRRSLAESLYFAGKYTEAANILEELRTKVSRTEVESAEAMDSERTSLTLMLGQCYLNLHRTVDARTCFQEVARTHPENPQAILGLAKVCIETNELSTALAAGRRVLRSDPQNVQAMIVVATVQQLQKRWDEALLTLESAAKISPADSTVLCMAGISQVKLGRQEVAVGYFEKAAVVNPQDTWASDLLAKYKPKVASPVIAPTPAAVITAPEPAPVAAVPALAEPVATKEPETVAPAPGMDILTPALTTAEPTAKPKGDDAP